MLAELYRLAPDPVHGRPLLPRLDASAEELDNAYRFLSVAVTKDAPAVGSEDWLRDNHHVVQDQVREIRQDLPRRYYLQLPKLADGPFAGYPRVYAFASELITHTAGRLDLQTLVDFATAYQRAAPLTIGEIWAIPIMLRLALVEELRRLAADVVAARRARDRARAWGVQLSTGCARAGAHHRRDAARRNREQRPSLRSVRRRAPSLAPRSALVCRAGMAGAAARARSSGRLARRDAPGGTPARGDRATRHRQHHHDDAAAVVDRLAALLRACQPGRTDPARRPGRSVCEDGLPDPRPLPALGRRAREGSELGRATRRAARRRTGGRGATLSTRSGPLASRRLLPDLARTLPPRA